MSHKRQNRVVYHDLVMKAAESDSGSSMEPWDSRTKTVAQQCFSYVGRKDASKPHTIRSIHFHVSWTRLPMDPRCWAFERVRKLCQHPSQDPFLPRGRQAFVRFEGSESAHMVPGILGWEGWTKRFTRIAKRFDAAVGRMEVDSVGSSFFRMEGSCIGHDFVRTQNPRCSSGRVPRESRVEREGVGSIKTPAFAWIEQGRPHSDVGHGPACTGIEALCQYRWPYGMQPLSVLVILRIACLTIKAYDPHPIRYVIWVHSAHCFHVTKKKELMDTTIFG